MRAGTPLVVRLADALRHPVQWFILCRVKRRFARTADRLREEAP